MGNCLKTQLKESVNNDTLIKLGDFVFRMKSVETPSSINRSFILTMSSAETIRVAGSGAYFTDSSLSSNLGTSLQIQANTETTIYVSNSSAKIIVPNKYNIKYFRKQYANSEGNFELNTNDLQYSILTNIDWDNSPNVSGDISKISNTVTRIGLSYCPQIKGEFNYTNLSPNIQWINTEGCQGVYGNIESFPVLSQLKYFDIAMCNFTGNFADSQILSNNPFIAELHIENTEISGDVSLVAQKLYDGGNRKNRFVFGAANTNVSYNGSIAPRTYVFDLSGDSPIIS